MIEINLLPEEQRAKTRKEVSSTAPIGAMDPTYLIYLVPVVAVILLLVHFYLGLAYFLKQNSFNSLNKEWASLAVQRQKVSNFKTETVANSQDAMIIDELINKSVRWSEKLNLLSLNLPPGVWFNEVIITPKSLDIKACVFSLESNGVDMINKFLFNLKNDRSFFKDFKNVETGNMLTRQLGTYEVMDFTVTGTLK